MANTIQLKRGTGSSEPSSLAEGELAINLDSGKLFYGSGSSVSSDFTVNKLTAETYVVSSSVTHMTTSFSSGSTAFGDSAGDTHTFTGDITASGNISSSAFIYASDFQAPLGINDGYHIGDGKPILAINGEGGYLSLGAAHSTYHAAGVNIYTTGSDSSKGLFLDSVGNITASGAISASGNITANAFVGNITGNLTGEADTVATIAGLAPNTATTQATQGAITSLGTLTGLTVSGHVEADSYHADLGNSKGYGLGATSTKPILSINAAGDPLNLGAPHASYVAAGVNIYTTGSDSSKGLFLDSVGNATASGDISASGTISAEHFYSSDDIVAAGDISASAGNVYGQTVNTPRINAEGNTNLYISSGIQVIGDITASAVSSSGNIYAADYFDNGANINTLYAPVLGADDNYVTDAEKTVIGNTSNTNSGNETTATVNALNITEVGALADGTIASGFGNIDNGSSTLDTGVATVASLVCTADATFGGGYGDTGATISTAGVGQFNGALTTDSSFTCTGTVLANGNGATTGARILLREGTDNGVNAIGFMCPAAVTTTTTFTLPDGDGSNGQALVTDGSAVLSWATAGGDPSGAQTGITTIFNTGTKIGYADNGANIDFTTDNNIIFDIDGTQQIQLADGVLKPVTDSDVDLGTDALRFKDAYVDSVTSAGIVTAKTYDYISCGFFDNLSTTLHYLPLNGKPTEQTSEGNSYTDWVAPCHTTVLSIQVRFSSIISSGGDITMTVWKDPVGSSTKASVEAETVSVGGSNDNDVIHFLFDGAVIDKGETMKISIQSTGGMTSANTFVTVVLLQDWNDRYTASSQVFTS